MSLCHNDASLEERPRVKHISLGDLPSEMKEIAQIIGLEGTVKLIARYNEQAIYFPKYETITLKMRDKVIRQEFDGNNIRALATKYNLSTRYIRYILRQK